MVKYLFFLCAFFPGCNTKNNKVNTIAIISVEDSASNIFIFFGQDTSTGNVVINGDKYFFNIEQGDQSFFLKEDIGKGYIEFYKAKGKEKVRVYYSSPMTLQETHDSSYQIVGGSLRTFYDSTNKHDVKYITFRANYAFMLKNKWEIGEKEVLYKYYSSVMK